MAALAAWLMTRIMEGWQAVMVVVIDGASLVIGVD